MNIKFFKNEIKDIIISILILSILFTLYFINRIHGSINNIILVLPITLIIMTISLIFKIYAQKSMAHRYSYAIQYHKWTYGLLFSLITIVLSIILLTPGYFDFKQYDRLATNDEKGKISVSGPIINIILAFISMIIVIILSPGATLMLTDASNIIFLTSLISFMINSYLSVSNLIPFMLLDGVNVLNWNSKVFIITIIISVILAGLALSNYFL